MDYYDFANSLQISETNIDKWFKLISKHKHVSYAILTTKHHDGYNVYKTGILKIFADKCRKYNLQFGVYYSWSEFNKTMTKKYLEKVSIEINEISEYKPDIWWFDGDWAIKTKYAQNFVDDICRKLRKQNPNVKINDRIGNKVKYLDPNYLGLASYRVYGDRYIPKEAPKVPWQHINTIGLSWGYNKMQGFLRHYKCPEELLEIYNNVKKMKGDFLLNFGPKYDCSLDENEVVIFSRFIKLLDK